MQDEHNLDFDKFDEVMSPPPAVTDFDAVVDEAISRRGFLGGVLAFGAGTFLVSTTAMTKGVAAATADRFGFEGIAASTADTITLPKGFKWEPVVLWGDPIKPGAPAFDHDTRGTAASQETSFGDNNDGMSIFTRDGRTVLVVNNEYTNRDIIWGNRPDNKPAEDDDIMKGKMAHGVTVVEVTSEGGRWKVVQDSALNRRITPDTEMALEGVASGHDLLKTAADPTGTKTLGTWNNCGNGQTPWGTYLACEENFNGYFSAADEEHKTSPELSRYGVRSTDWGYGWAKVDERFDVSKHPNEPNRAGYVVEIDPWNPDSTPIKRTSLGRFKHENADVVLAADGTVVVYMGDDERGEYLYKFVSDRKYSALGDNSGALSSGKLYAAKFEADQTGKWLELSEAATGMTNAEIAIHTRLAASAVKATTMDRPEWVASNPVKVESYVALTNNKNRGVKPNAGGDDTSANPANPREENLYGQILRWMPDGEDHTADTFTWNLFALAGNPEVHDGTDRAGSPNINAGNMFNSPDGLSFDENGMLWIQTDGNYSNAEDFAGMGNNQMLVGDTQTGEIRRFMVGPNEAEITGLAWAPDRRTVFVGIQHPGEDGNSHFPDGGTTVPRSGVIAVSREDGGLLG